jgi:outer membrane protein assembly factor BamB
MLVRALLILALLVDSAGILSVNVLRAEDFPSFRGVNGCGVAPDQAIPLTWSEDQNLAWKAELPGSGWSQPVVIGDRVFVTAAVADKDLKPKNFSDGVKTPQSMGISLFSKAPDVTIEWKVFCLNAIDGVVLWNETIHSAKPKYPIHPSNTFATESPVADQNGIYVHFGAAGILAGLSLDGRKMWSKDVGVHKTSNSFGTGSSLAIDDDRVYLQNLSEESADITCYATQTGDVLWQAAREKKSTAWSSPVIWNNSRRKELIVSGDQLVESFDPASGAALWKVSRVKAATACSPCADSERLYFGGSDPFSKGPLFAVAVGASGDVSPAKSNDSFESNVWKQDRAGPGMASPVSTGEHVYVVDRNILRCYQAESGELLYQSRLPGLEMVAASPLIIGNKLLIIDEAGSGCVVATGGEFRVIGSGSINDTVWATPAVANGAVFLRGVEGLYCIRSAQ